LLSGNTFKKAYKKCRRKPDQTKHSKQRVMNARKGACLKKKETEGDCGVSAARARTSGKKGIFLQGEMRER